jgi:hypothetical protein
MDKNAQSPFPSKRCSACHTICRRCAPRVTRRGDHLRPHRRRPARPQRGAGPKDFASVSDTAGKPKYGVSNSELIAAIERTLGYDNSNDAVLCRAGSLGARAALLRGFEAYGMSM